MSFYSFTVRTVAEQEVILLQLLKRHWGQSGVVFTATQETAVYLTRLINHYWPDSLAVIAYHAGLDWKKRSAVRQQFSSGSIQLVVATNAFTHVPDQFKLKFIIHYQLPGSLETYYQQTIGKRFDQVETAYYLINNPADLAIRQSLIDQSDHDSVNQLRQVVNYARTRLCRVKFLQQHFGQTGLYDCGQCDNCRHNFSLWSTTDSLLIERLTITTHELAGRYRTNQNLILTPEQICLMAIYRPLTVTDFAKLPGIGRGWLEKWYNTLSTKIKKGAIYGINSPTTLRPVP